MGCCSVISKYRKNEDETLKTVYVEEADGTFSYLFVLINLQQGITMWSKKFPTLRAAQDSLDDYADRKEYEWDGGSERVQQAVWDATRGRYRLVKFKSRVKWVDDKNAGDSTMQGLQ